MEYQTQGLVNFSTEQDRGRFSVLFCVVTSEGTEHTGCKIPLEKPLEGLTPKNDRTGVKNSEYQSEFIRSTSDRFHQENGTNAPALVRSLFEIRAFYGFGKES